VEIVSSASFPQTANAWGLTPQRFLFSNIVARGGLNPSCQNDIITNMKTISLSVSESDYEAYRKASKKQNRSIALLIREAMAEYRASKLREQSRLTDVPALPGHRLIGNLPSREEIYDEIFRREEETT